MSVRLLLIALALLTSAGCSNAINPFCGNVRPSPEIGSISPSTVALSDLDQGVLLTVNGSNFVPASEIVVNGKALAATALSSSKLQVMLNSAVISQQGSVNVKVMTPSGNSGDVGCTSGGTSSILVLTID
ncbi:MAG TPA: IPT/TIG domain-containing protein [Terriglobales bacterium]|nr:IPT/TIG domain-containing protein [Terriglobales bacterium]